MNTQDFLTRILPDAGLRVVVSIGPAGPRQKFYPTNEAAAAALIAADNQGTNAYHGCASYKDNTSRKAHNVEAVKALWVDIDVGDNKPYTSQREAGTAAVEFTKAVGLHAPLLVNSGRGLHVYWIFETDVSPQDWLVAATALKQAAQHWGLKAGPERTADIASILRPAGTHHRKAEPLEVRVIRDGADAPYDFVMTRLQEYLTAHELDVLGPAPAYAAADNSDLDVKYDAPPAPIEPILEGCAIIREFRDSRGQIEEPLWRACMGVVRHCEDGVELCHEWSSGHPKYSEAETDAKLEGLGDTGPTSCAVLGQYRPEACANCPLGGRIKSPIVAARLPVEVLEVPDPVDPEQSYPIPTMPKSYKYSTEGLTGEWKDPKTEAWKDVVFSKILFYPVAWVTDTEKNRSLRIRVHLRDTEVEDFTLPCATITEGGSKLLGALGAKMITTEKGRGIMVQHYLQEWMNTLRSGTASMASYDRFGWYGKDFLLGSTMYRADGSTEIVVLSGSALTQEESYTPRGSLPVWVDAVERAYNHASLEPLQFALLAGMASPLLSMFDDYGGVTVYMHTQESGIGKTTISRAALSCYSAWKDGQLTHGQYTQNALYATFGTANALPLALDEMTHVDPKVAAEMVHLISAGTAKKRCGKTGSMLKSDHRWSLFALASGNNLLTEKIAQFRAQAAAENARVFEYSIEGLRSPIEPEEAATLFPTFAHNYGVAGREFIKYITTNYDDVKETLLKAHATICPVLGIQQSERYWGTLVACVLTAHKIATKLGLVQFPRKPLVAFMQDALQQNRDAMVNAKPSARDQLGRMISDLWSGIFVTHGQGDIYHRWDAFVAKESSGPVTGRYIMRRPGPEGVNDKPAIYLSMPAVNKWCADRNVSVRDLMREASSKGLVGATPKPVQLGRGSVKYSGLTSVNCLVVNEVALPDTMSPGVPQFTVVQGAKVKP